MPRYELALILKAMQRPETVASVRRTVETLMERGAVVRDLECLGERMLPFNMHRHGQKHTRGTYFLIDFYSPPDILVSLQDHLRRDVDVVRPTLLMKDPPVRLKYHQRCDVKKLSSLVSGQNGSSPP